jgi:deazaflavin-dependent oxidoreductase (nitroreductase family)
MATPSALRVRAAVLLVDVLEALVAVPNRRHRAGAALPQPGAGIRGERMIWKYFGQAHKALYRLSGGRLGARMGWIDVVLVDTIGRKSGKVRTVPIACYPYRDSVVVSASNGGQDTHPAWYLNMRANPRVTVQMGRERFEALAEDVPASERDAVWQNVVELNHHQGRYLEKTDRKIPLVWLRRL